MVFNAEAPRDYFGKGQRIKDLTALPYFWKPSDMEAKPVTEPKGNYQCGRQRESREACVVNSEKHEILVFAYYIIF